VATKVEPTSEKLSFYCVWTKDKVQKNNLAQWTTPSSGTIELRRYSFLK